MVDHDSELPTLKQIHVPVALVIDGSEEVISAVSKAALSAQVLIAECTSADAATMAAQMRPLVLIAPHDVYQREWENFEALARDLRASMMPLSPGDLDPTHLEGELTRLMGEAERRRPSWTDELQH